MSEYPRIAGINYESLVDGQGVRTVIYFSGCTHNCPGCQNADVQNPDAGEECTEELLKTIADEINKRPFVKGITLSGGDPLYEPEKTYNFLRALWKLLRVDKSKFDVWLYTGYTWKQIKEDLIPNVGHVFDLLCATAVLVDGRFVKDLADKRLRFRGSRNQQIIDVQKSLPRALDKLVLWRNKRNDIANTGTHADG